MLKSFFLSERKLVYAILRVKAWVHERCFFLMKWRCYLQCRRQIFNVLELFCRASYVRASMHRITSLSSKNTNCCVSAKKQMKRCKPIICWKSFFLSERKLVYAILRVEAWVHERCSFLMNEVLELQCTESLVWASKNTNCCVSAKKQMKRLQAHICWKASFSVRESWFMQF